MGRPRLHHTAEEQLQAARARRNKYYHSHREAISLKRQTAYRVKTSVLFPPEELMATSPAKKSPKAPIKSVDPLEEQLRVAEADMRRMFGGASPKGFVQKAYSSFCISVEPDSPEGDTDIFCNPIEAFEELHTRLDRTRDSYLQHEGMGPNWEKTEKRCQTLRRTIRWLEDILCYALSDIPELYSMHSKSKLLFQE